MIMIVTVAGWTAAMVVMPIEMTTERAPRTIITTIAATTAEAEATPLPQQ